jgi:hypothetical protein
LLRYNQKHQQPSKSWEISRQIVDKFLDIVDIAFRICGPAVEFRELAGISQRGFGQ